MLNNQQRGRRCSDSRLIRRLVRVCAGGLAMTVMMLITATSGAAAAGSCAAGVASLSAAYQPACWTPFSASSPVNATLPAGPRLAANNAAVLGHMASYGWSFQGGPSTFQITGDGSRPVYFASPNDPVMTVHCTNAFGPGSCRPTVDGAQIHVPAGAAPSNNWDAHMIIIQTATGQEYDFWHTQISGSTLNVGTGAVENVNTSDGTKDGGDAADLALTAGLLRPSELASGHIDHALAVDIPCTDAHGPNVGYVWPATTGNGEPCGQYWSETPAGAPHLGQLFQLNMTDAQIAASGAPPWEQTIMTALAHYGAYAEDTNGSYRDEHIQFFQQDPTSWTSIGQPNQWANAITALGGHNNTLTSPIPIPTNRLQIVDPCVPEGLCPTTTPPVVTPTATPPPTTTPPPQTTTAVVRHRGRPAQAARVHRRRTRRTDRARRRSHHRRSGRTHRARHRIHHRRHHHQRAHVRHHHHRRAHVRRHHHHRRAHVRRHHHRRRAHASRTGS